jgi:hypothetical protein
MPTSKLSRRALLTVAFGVALVVQAAVSFVVEPEPYPAIKMPSFGDAPKSSGIFPTSIASATITYTDGSTLTPHISELLDDFRFSSAQYSFDYVFKPGSGRAADPEVTEWLAARARELAPGRVPDRVDMCWQKAALNIRSAEYESLTPCESVRIKL